MRKRHKIAVLALIVSIMIAYITSTEFAKMHVEDNVVCGPGVTAVKMLSDYYPDLKGTGGDTKVYVFDSGKPGGTALLLGGTHPIEASGYMTAFLLVENAVPAQGRLIVIPQANASAFTHHDYMEASPDGFVIKTSSGARWFRFGSRATNSIDQWPDPDVYVHAASGQQLSGSETRNLNRAHPGRPDGNLTEKVAYGIMQVIKSEKVTIGIDLHEASPEYPVVNAIVAHENSMDIAATALMNLQLDGMKIKLEASPKNLHGLTHREWGDHAGIYAVLFETANPAQGRMHGVTNEALVVEGKDDLYAQADKIGRLFVDYGNGWPLNERVARNVASIQEVLKAYSNKETDKPVILTNLPNYQQILTEGIGKFLK